LGERSKTGGNISVAASFEREKPLCRLRKAPFLLPSPSSRGRCGRAYRSSPRREEGGGGGEGGRGRRHFPLALALTNRIFFPLERGVGLVYFGDSLTKREREERERREREREREGKRAGKREKESSSHG
jgi:hypothetical protein